MAFPKKVPKRLSAAVIALAGVILVGLSVVVVFLNRPTGTASELGITFSTVQANHLGLHARETYAALVDELGVDLVRLPVYWDEVERVNDEYSWEEFDWLMEKSEQSGVRVTLVIGQKVPRWPECFIPDWAERLEEDERHQELLSFMEQVVLRYKDSPALVRWQVENELFFPFGICPKPSAQHLAEEIDLVRSLDSHPIQLTVSGELEPYVDAAIPADVLGISLYRVTWNTFLGYFYYPLTPGYYRLKLAGVQPFVDNAVISELQAEPWFPEPLSNRSPADWAKVFDADDLLRNVDFARRVGVDEIYLWGAEWWYFLKQHDNPELWEAAKGLFADVL